MYGDAIDDTHIPIGTPHGSQIDHVNRKGYNSIIIQAVADVNHLFRDIHVFIGWPGSVHSAGVFSNSSIFKGNKNELLHLRIA